MSVTGKVALHDVEIPVPIIVTGRNAHAGLRLPIRTQRGSRGDGNIFELSVLEILIQSARGGIVRNINIWPAIIIEVCYQDAEPIGPVVFSNAARFRHICERSVSVVVIQNVFSALQPRWTA